jgi:hypothetical protein
MAQAEEQAVKQLAEVESKRLADEAALEAEAEAAAAARAQELAQIEARERLVARQVLYCGMWGGGGLQSQSRDCGDRDDDDDGGACVRVDLFP